MKSRQRGRIDRIKEKKIDLTLSSDGIKWQWLSLGWNNNSMHASPIASQ
jgi:hypothetical protein